MSMNFIKSSRREKKKMIRTIKLIRLPERDVNYITCVGGNVRFWSAEQFNKNLTNAFVGYKILGPIYYKNYYCGDIENDEAWDLFNKGKMYIDITYQGLEEQEIFEKFKKLWCLLKEKGNDE